MENKEFGNKNTKKNTWENNLVFDRNEEQSKYPKSIFLFEFPNPLKQNKDQIFKALKLFLKLVKTLEKL